VSRTLDVAEAVDTGLASVYRIVSSRPSVSRSLVLRIALREASLDSGKGWRFARTIVCESAGRCLAPQR
jgi:hypothetical protein